MGNTAWVELVRAGRSPEALAREALKALGVGRRADLAETGHPYPRERSTDFGRNGWRWRVIPGALCLMSVDKHISSSRG